MNAIGAQVGLVNTFKSLARLMAVVVICIGSLNFVGWLSDITALKTVLPSLVTAKINTALAFVLVGVALLILHRESLNNRERRLIMGSAIIIALLGLPALGNYVFDWNLGINPWLIPDHGGLGYLTRLLPLEAFDFLFLSISLFLLAQSRNYSLAQMFSLMVGFVSLLALVGDLYTITGVYQISSSIAIALATIIAFILASLSILMTRPDQGIITILTSSSAGGILVRRLLPAALILPILFGWLRLIGQRLGLYNTEFGVSLFTLSNIIFFSVLIGWIAHFLHQIDDKRQQAEDALYEAHSALERQVKERTADLAQTNQQLQMEIIERKRAEEALRESKHFTERILDTTPDIVFVYDVVEQRNVYTNREVMTILGYTPQQLQSMGTEAPTILVHPDDLAKFAERNQKRRGLKEGEILEFETRMKHTNGTWRWLYGRETLFLRSPDGLPQQTVGMARDVTERKLAEEELRESEERYRQLFNQIDDYIIVHDKDSNILDANQAASEHLGYSHDELLRMKTVDIDTPDYAKGFYNRLDHQLAHGRLRDIQGVHTTRDGRQIPAMINSRAITYEGQAAVLAICRDMTEYHRLEQQVLQLEKERQQIKFLTDFINNISHDFRTPLTVISTSIHLLEKQTDSELKKQRLELIETQIAYLSTLLERLLMMAKLDNDISLQSEPLNVNLLVQEMEPALQALVQDKGLELALSLDENIPRVQASIDELGLALKELLDNAVEYTASGGKITVRTHHAGTYVSIEIRDTGVGISQADLPYVFERLHRADKARSVGAEHIGLGLSLWINQLNG